MESAPAVRSDSLVEQRRFEAALFLPFFAGSSEPAAQLPGRRQRRITSVRHFHQPARSRLPWGSGDHAR